MKQGRGRVVTSTPVKRVTRASAKITGMLPEDSVLLERCPHFKFFMRGVHALLLFTLKDKVVGYCLQTFLAGIYKFFY